ncbi:MAG: MBL fold metallo-hydrolase [bacterium]|nr:MBL fold metallo-hydrolase [bacterium]
MKSKSIILVVVLLLALDLLVWRTIILINPSDDLTIYFLSVGQGDSELVILPGGVKVLIDGGPNNEVLTDLAAILPQTDRYIDLVINSHPEIDHFLGLIDVLKNYRVGTFISNGREGTADSWQALVEVLKNSKIPAVSLAAGDRIRYRENYFDILSPDKNFINNKDLNDTSLVVLLKSQNLKALFVGDIGVKPEKYLAAKFDISADILKVGHHGSKYSSIADFLKAVSPKIAVTEVGKNTYGHPTKEVLDRLASIGAQIYRTDNNGTVKIVVAKDSSQIQVFKEK